MERGPMALFGAIVAVGLGPALWLGAQLSVVNTIPSVPAPAVDERRARVGGPLVDATNRQDGGVGAGDPDPDARPSAERVKTVKPSRSSRRVTPSGGVPSPSVSPSASAASGDDLPVGASTEPTRTPGAGAMRPGGGTSGKGAGRGARNGDGHAGAGGLLNGLTVDLRPQRTTR